MNKQQVISAASSNDKSLLIIRDIESPSPHIQPKGLPVISPELPDECEDGDDDEQMSRRSGGGGDDDITSHDPDDLDDDIEKSVPLSSLAWEAFELSSDWSKSLKGDHGILAALDLSLPLPMCNVDLSSPTKPRDILDIFSDVMDLPPLNNFIDNRIDAGGDRAPFTIDQASGSAETDEISIGSSSAAVVTKPIPGVGGEAVGSRSKSGNEDRSNTLMTPQELERMPDQGLEFEQSVGPKELPKLLPATSMSGVQRETDSIIDASENHMLTEDQMASMSAADAPIILSRKGDELTTITVLTSQGEKMFKVNTAQLRQAAALMQPVIINASDEAESISKLNTDPRRKNPPMKSIKKAKVNSALVMLPVAKMKLQPSSDNSEPKYKCLHCGKTFPRSYKLRLHEMMKHSVDKPFKCQYPDCKWAFADAYRLRNHERSHTKIKDHQCTICGRMYASVWNLRTHMDQLHNDKNRYFKCELCEQTFTAETKLHKHYSDEHPDKPKQFRCDEEGCDFEFHSKLGLMRHMSGHKKRENLSLVCPIEGCGREFKWQSRYNLHLRSHNEERPYKCTFQGCTAAFTNGSALNRHLKRHDSSAKLSKCQICDKTFHRNDHLKNHMAMHSGARPFPCTEPGCKLSCPTKSALVMHLKRHAIRANRVMLVCPDVNCGAKFSTKPQIIKHIHAHHPHVVEIQYSKELEAAEDDGVEMDEGLVAANSVAALSNSIDWNYGVSNEASPLTIVNTQVGEREIELLLPAPLIQTAVSGAVSDLRQHDTTTVKSEKGSARTDRSVNDQMCTKARQRQQQQKEQAMLPLSTAHIPSPMDVTPVVSQIVPSSIEIYNTTSSHVETSSQPTVRGVVSSNTTGNEVVAITTTLPVSAGNLTAMPNIEQWFTTVNQDEVVGDGTMVSTADGDLEQLSGPIEDNAVFSQLLDFPTNQ